MKSIAIGLAESPLFKGIQVYSDSLFLCPLDQQDCAARYLPRKKKA